MELLIRSINRISSALGHVSSWLLSALVVIICIDVVLRYVFSNSNPAISEFEWHIFSFVILMGMGFTLSHGKHVRVDVFYHRFSQNTQHWVDFFGIVLLLIPFCVIMMKSSIPYAENSFLMNERSADPGGLPYRWLIKFSIPIGFLFLLLQTFSWLLQTIEKLLKRTVKEDVND